MHFTASDGEKHYIDSDVRIQGPDVELHPNLLEASFHTFQVKIVYRTQQMKKAKEALESKVKPISTAGPESSSGTTRRRYLDSPLKGFNTSRKVNIKGECKKGGSKRSEPECTEETRDTMRLWRGPNECACVLAIQ